MLGIFKNKSANIDLLKTDIPIDKPSKKIKNKPLIKTFDRLNDLQNQYIIDNYRIIRKIYEKTNKKMLIAEYNNEEVVLKIRNINLLNDDEINVYKKLEKIKHLNIIQTYDLKILDTYYYSVHPYIDGCNLAIHINKNYNIHDIFKQIVIGLNHLHSNDIIHCDIKLQNIMIDHNNIIKIIDFDLSKICTSKKGIIVDKCFGTQPYIAPENIDLKIYSKMSDVWSLGVLLYFMLMKKFPFYQNITETHTITNIICKRNIYKHIDFDNCNHDENLINICKRMLRFKDYKRITLDKILKKI